MEYQVHYEIAVDGETINDVMAVEANDATRAVEYTTEVLDQKYDGDAVLLVCEVI